MKGIANLNSLAQAMQSVLERSKTDRSNLSFWRDMSYLNATLRCGHSVFNLPTSLRNIILGPKSQFPPLLVFNNKEGVFIKKVLEYWETVRCGMCVFLSCQHRSIVVSFSNI